MMKSAVVLATHNGEKYLSEQLRSIATQSLTVNLLVLVDDCSSDATVAIAKGFRGEFADIMIIELKENVGTALAFEVGLAAVYDDIDVIFFSDQDDVWRHDRVEINLACFKSESECVVAISDLELVDSTLKSTGGSYMKASYGEDPSKAHVLNLLFRNAAPGCAMTIRKSLLNSVMPFPPDVVMHDWWILLVGSYVGKVQYLPDRLVMYRQHGGNQLGAGNAGLNMLVRRIRRVGGIIRYLSYREDRRRRMLDLLLNLKVSTAESCAVSRATLLTLHNAYRMKGFTRFRGVKVLVQILEHRVSRKFVVVEIFFYLITGFLVKQ